MILVFVLMSIIPLPKYSRDVVDVTIYKSYLIPHKNCGFRKEITFERLIFKMLCVILD